MESDRQMVRFGLVADFPAGRNSCTHQIRLRHPDCPGCEPRLKLLDRAQRFTHGERRLDLLRQRLMSGDVVRLERGFDPKNAESVELFADSLSRAELVFPHKIDVEWVIV